ncbi:hypothetical protein GSI_07815 [Ganoderma sinense ZZ0214-1]|uniref:Uncharacterized protein n=1 Tax=Ganoderma sinense ZZ0214-1 TaxID=1077348 RepID=A0A2G8S832_9APHY|nr:hypothetical protein GSI_07815 [Ganoderma sinense ZZ0214-1]
MTHADNAHTIYPDIPTVPTILASLDTFDAMADMLDMDALAVPLDLLLSTTRRALRALGALLSASLASPSYSLPGSSSTMGTGLVSVSRIQTNLNPAADDAPSGVRDPLRALALLDATLHRVLRTVFSALAAHLPDPSPGLRGPCWRSTQIPQKEMEVRAALDDFLGNLYELVLAPLVRAFSPASEGFVSACLLRSCSRSQSSSGFGSGFGSGSGINFGDEYPLPGVGANSETDNLRERDKDKDSERAVADLRPVLFDVLERALSTLEAQCLRLELGSSGAGPESRAGDEESILGSGSANTGDGGHTSKLGLGFQAQAIRGVREVKRLLALDCVRELERMYTSAPSSLPSYHRDAAADSESSDDHPDASIRRRSDEAPGGSATTRRAQGTLPHSLHPSLPLLAAQWSPGSARTCAPMRKAHASRAGADRNREAWASGTGTGSEDATRPGTPASPAATTSPALGPLRAQAQHRGGERSAALARLQASARRTGGAAGRTRLAGNLGEIRTGGVAESDEDEGGGDVGAALGLAFAHAQGRTARGEGEGEDRDLRVDDDEDDGGLGMEKQFRERVVRLARKDTAWYLCAVLNRLLPRGTPPNGDSAAGSSSTTEGDAKSNSMSSDPSRLGADDVDVHAATATANANPRGNASVKANRKLSLTNPDDTDTIADEAVYSALVDLLRRSRPAHSPFLSGRRGSDPSTRADTAEASIRDHRGGSSAGGADLHEQQHAYRDARDGDSGHGLGLGNGTAAMGAVERGMLLAVFERAWLGM